MKNPKMKGGEHPFKLFVYQLTFSLTNISRALIHVTTYSVNSYYITSSAQVETTLHNEDISSFPLHMKVVSNPQCHLRSTDGDTCTQCLLIA